MKMECKTTAPNLCVHEATHHKFEINHILGIIAGKLAKWDIRVQPIEFPFFDTKTCVSFVGTHNGFYPDVLGDCSNKDETA